MKSMMNRLPSRQALRVIRRLRRRYGPNHGDSLLQEAEAALKCGDARGAVAALQKFLLVAVKLDGDERGLVQLALDHLQNEGLLSRAVGSIVRLATMPLAQLLNHCVKSLLNYFQSEGLGWQRLLIAFQNSLGCLDCQRENFELWQLRLLNCIVQSADGRQTAEFG